jgi:hypothetical protein
MNFLSENSWSAACKLRGKAGSIGKSAIFAKKQPAGLNDGLFVGTDYGVVKLNTVDQSLAYVPLTLTRQ